MTDKKIMNLNKKIYFYKISTFKNFVILKDRNINKNFKEKIKNISVILFKPIV